MWDLNARTHACSFKLTRLHCSTIEVHFWDLTQGDESESKRDVVNYYIKVTVQSRISSNSFVLNNFTIISFTQNWRTVEVLHFSFLLFFLHKSVTFIERWENVDGKWQLILKVCVKTENLCFKRTVGDIYFSNILPWDLVKL